MLADISGVKPFKDRLTWPMLGRGGEAPHSPFGSSLGTVEVRLLQPDVNASCSFSASVNRTPLDGSRGDELVDEIPVNALISLCHLQFL